MSRVSRLLVFVIVVEIIVGGFVVVRRMQRPAPPEADWSLLDRNTAAQIQSAIGNCNSANDWRDLGEMYMAAGCFAESEACQRVACELAPDNAVFARQWGFALERIGLLDEANVQYQRAIELRTPDPDGCRYFIARNHLRVENRTEARRVFAEGKALPANRYELARLHLRDRDLAQGSDLLRSVGEVRPTALQVNQLGYRLALERGDARETFISAERAIYAPEKLQNPFDEEVERIISATKLLGPNLQWKQASDLIDAGKLDDAQLVLAGSHRTPAIVELIADVLIRRQAFDAAIAWLTELEKPNGPAALVAHIGDVWEAAGQPEKARANWLRAAEIGAGVDPVATHRKLAKSFESAGDKAATDRHVAIGLYFVGRDLLKTGHPDEAISFFAAAVENNPKFEHAWFYLGETQRLSGQTEAAKKAYQSCLSLNPNHGRALASLAFMDHAKK